MPGMRACGRVTLKLRIRCAGLATCLTTAAHGPHPPAVQGMAMRRWASRGSSWALVQRAAMSAAASWRATPLRTSEAGREVRKVCKVATATCVAAPTNTCGPACLLQAVRRALADRRHAAHAAAARGAEVPVNLPDAALGEGLGRATHNRQQLNAERRGMAQHAMVLAVLWIYCRPTSLHAHFLAPGNRQAGDSWLGTLNLRFSKQAGPAPANGGGAQAPPAPSRLVPLPFAGGTFNSTYNLAQHNPFVFKTPRRLTRAVITSLITGGDVWGLQLMGFACRAVVRRRCGCSAGVGCSQEGDERSRRGSGASSSGQRPSHASCAQPPVAQAANRPARRCHLQATDTTPLAAPSSAPASTGSQSTANCTATRWAHAPAATMVQRRREGGHGSMCNGSGAAAGVRAAQLQPALLRFPACPRASPQTAACCVQAAPTLCWTAACQMTRAHGCWAAPAGATAAT